ncbi:MAG: efflux RND transporter periplasmic adaptor subunit [Verrucomicrobiota bacterium]|nr:efflux RND transporter periplasmic adaptor subunit [Verrucomicrobiota bacterium]
MKYSLFLFLIPIAVGFSFAADSGRKANTIILDQTAVQNLRLELVATTEETFETTVFAIGRIEEISANRSALASRIPGRVIELNAHVGDEVEQGQVLAVIESRQPGDPPPSVELKALLGGLVVDTHARIGEPVEPDSDLLDISDRSSVWAVARIPEPEAANIVPGTKARIRIPALGETFIEATLDRYGVEANREAGTLEGIFVLDNSEGRLQPGMRVEFSIITRSRKNVMAVPHEAIQGDPTKRVVFVEDFELPNAFIRAPVVLGEENDRYVEIINGLFPGDEVVTRGSYALSFAGSGSGISLKEALDAAHGHEHAEDGSELTDEQRAAEQAENEGATESKELSPALKSGALIWAGVATLLCLILGQMLWSTKRKAESPAES